MTVSPQRILITGARGFVGRRLAAALRRRWPEIVLVLADRTAQADTQDASSQGLAEAVAFDISDPASVDALVKKARPDVVVHLAAISSVPASLADPRQTWATNTMGVLDLTLAIQAHAPECRLLYVSSAEVYGRSAFSGVPVSENAVLLPNNPYAASKAAADIMVQEAAGRGLKATVVRPFNHTGPGQDDRFVIPAFCSQIARIEKGLQPPLMKVGELNDERDFLDVDDVIDLYVRIVEHGDGLPNGTVLNAASGASRRIGDILSDLTGMSTSTISVEVDPARLRPTRVPRIVGDAARARELLGWSATKPFQHTLRETLEDWRSRD